MWFIIQPWYSLNQAKQNEQTEKVGQALVHHNGKEPLVCASLSERWAMWGIEEFPDLQSQQMHSLELHNFEMKTLLGCFSAWSDEQWAGFVLESYPSQEAVQERHMKLWEMGWYRYTRATSTLGVKWPLES